MKSFYLVLQVGIEEILFAKSRTHALVNCISKRNIYICRIQATLFLCFLVFIPPTFGANIWQLGLIHN